MKTVDKYGLALEPRGTAFYRLDEHGMIDGEMMILTSWPAGKEMDGKPFFCGVTRVRPDEECGENGYGYGFDMDDPGNELPNDDLDSSDFSDSDRFLALSKADLGVIINYLHGCYDMLPNPKEDVTIDLSGLSLIGALSWGGDLFYEQIDSEDGKYRFDYSVHYGEHRFSLWAKEKNGNLPRISVRGTGEDRSKAIEAFVEDADDKGLVLHFVSEMPKED